MRQLLVLLILFCVLAGFPVLSGAQGEGYELAPLDTLQISVWKDENLSRQLQIPPDGVISFPLIGDVDAKGMTIPELRGVVEKRLSEYKPDPTVTVMLLQAESLRAYVIGKVNNPGQFPITGKTNVMQILSMAGGLNPFASGKEILVLRQEGAETVKIPFNYHEVEDGEHLEQNIILERGDVVVVP